MMIKRKKKIESQAGQAPLPPIPIPKDYDEKRIEETFWPKLKRVAAAVPGVSDILALYFYLNSDKASIQHKVSIMATLAYFIMPMDILPDFMAGLGYTDDVAVALGLIKFIGSDVMKPYRIYARKWLKGDSAKKKTSRKPKALLESPSPDAAA